MPADTRVLASSDACAVQAFRYRDNAYGFQFHVEITEQTVADWAAIPVYAQALDAALGQGAVGRLNSQVAAKLPTFNRNAKSIYDNFKGVLQQAASVHAQK